MNAVRCAIYTRKSSEEGLEQDFNSLDAQREACAAFVKSQASEGWKLLPEHYDDGGLSGGTLERPALQRLLADVKAGHIDIIVVYKVDRLTRSLLDFARLVETFDASGTSFVSVTQSFNTTTSMGRLTLNMLLSFAQFEREVTAERIRDKIAASKAKGMWMGGTPPLGYKPDGRSLAIVEEQAALIRDIFARYRTVGAVRQVAEALDAEGIRTPRRVNGKGRAYGGCVFTRGQIYAILKNPIYAGDITHRGKVYPGQHEAIIPRDEWEAVQQQLADHVKGERRTREANTSLLAGLLCDPEGEPLVPVHANKSVKDTNEGGRKRYCYYVRKSDQHGTGNASTPSLRLPAREIEQVVSQELQSLLTDPPALLARCELDVPPHMLDLVAGKATILRHDLNRPGRSTVTALIEQINVHPDRLVLDLCVNGIAEQLGLSVNQRHKGHIFHEVSVRLRRTGRALRLVQADGRHATNTEPDLTLARLIFRARGWWAELATGEITIAALARRENIQAAYITRVVRLAFLAPDVVEAIASGKTRANIDAKALLATGAITASWEPQKTKMLAGKR